MDIVSRLDARRPARGAASALALAAVLLGSASCGTDQKVYGPTTAGPTKTSTPSLVADEPSTPAAGTPRPEARHRGGGLCGLFTPAEVGRWLGLPVGKGALSSDGGYQQCTWKATVVPRVPSWRVGDPVLDTDDGVVSITRGSSGQYADLEQRVVAVAGSKRAGGRQELPELGSAAFAIGGSVSGVPIWRAVTLRGDAVIAVEVSGADSRSSVSRVTGFLTQTLARL